MSIYDPQLSTLSLAVHSLRNTTTCLNSYNASAIECAKSSNGYVRITFVGI